MNPLAQQLQNQNPINVLISKITSGQVDAKSEALKTIAGFSPQQKTQLKNALPMIQKVAKRAGIPTDAIASFSKEVTANLA